MQESISWGHPGFWGDDRCSSLSPPDWHGGTDWSTLVSFCPSDQSKLQADWIRPSSSKYLEADGRLPAGIMNRAVADAWRCLPFAEGEKRAWLPFLCISCKMMTPCGKILCYMYEATRVEKGRLDLFPRILRDPKTTCLSCKFIKNCCLPCSSLLTTSSAAAVPFCLFLGGTRVMVRHLCFRKTCETPSSTR